MLNCRRGLSRRQQCVLMGIGNSFPAESGEFSQESSEVGQ
jgi:hypothetical protein